MSAQDWEDLVERYREWIDRGVTLDEVAGWAEVTTPFLDRHNDHVQVYALRTDTGYRLTDDGHALSDLASSGVDVSKGQRAQVLETILNGFDITKTRDGDLIVDATAENVGQRMHNLIQAVLAVDDLYVLARHRVAALFFEDVAAFLRQSQIPFEQNAKLVGKSAYTQRVNFLIPRRDDDHPTSILQAIPTTTKQVVGNEIWLMEDVRQAQGGPMKAYALLDDRTEPIPEESLEAFDHYNIVAAPWSDRERVRADLVPAA